MSVLLLAALATTAPTKINPAPRPLPVARVDIRVTDRAGKPLTAARVVINGASDRQGATGFTGRVSFQNVLAGTYTLRVERDSYIPLEKEFRIAPGHPASVVASLSQSTSSGRSSLKGLAGPAAEVTAIPASSPRTLSIPALAEQQLIREESVKESPIACSGASDARLIQVREPLAPHAHGDADEMLYVVSGEGTLTINGNEQRVAAGWFSMVPRGSVHAITRRSRSAIIVLSMLNGHPCAPTVAMASR